MSEAILLQLNREKTIFWSLLAILVLCAAFYMYCINTTVHNIVIRQNLENDASSLALTIGSEEFRYISMRNGVTLAMAYSLGFADVTEKTFISKKTQNQVSYLNH